MAEIAGSNIDNRVDQGPQGLEFIPDAEGTIRIQTSDGLITIINGHTVDGEESALVFGVDSPPELVLGEDNATESTGTLSRLTRHPFGRIAAGITLAAGAVVGAGAALSACAPGTNGPNQPTYGIHQGALTLNQILSVGQGQAIPWSINGDDYPSNRVVINGENYLFATRNGGSIVYLKCQALADCFSPNANVQTLQGLNAIGLAQPGSGWGIDVYQNQAGNNKALIDDEDPFGNEFNHTCDIDSNANGVLEVGNCVETIPPWDGKPSVFPKNGKPHLLWNNGGIVKFRDLLANPPIDQNTAASADWANSCGVGVETEDGTTVIGSQKQIIQGVTHCRLVTASSWAELVANPIALQSLNQGSNDVTSPRLFGNYIVYRYNSKLRFVEIPAPPQNPEPDAGAPDAGQPVPDANQPDAVVIPPADAGPEVPPIVDAGPAPDAQLDPGDVAQDITDAADAVVEPDAGPDLPPPPIDAGQELPPEQDTGPDLPPPPVDSGPELPPPADTGPDIPPAKDATPDLPPDTSIQECATTLPEFTLKTPDCTLKVCPKDLNQLKGHTVEVNGSNTICSADIIINGKPVTLTMSNDKNGKIQVTCELFPGQNLVCEPGFNTIAKVDEEGAGTKLKTHGITVGSEASSFQIVPRGKNNSGQEIFEAASFNLPGEPKVFAVSDGGKFAKIEIPSNGKTFIINTETGEISEKQTTSTPDTGPITADNGPNEVDAGVPGQEKDTSVPTSSNNPDNNGGCQTGPNSQSSNHETTALILTAMGLFLMYRRRQEESRKALQPTSILIRTWGRIARSLGFHR